MRAQTLITTLALGAVIVAGGAALAPVMAQSNIAGNAQASRLSVHEVQLKVEALGYHDLSTLERERDKDEIKATDAQGRLVTIDVDPFTGEILKTEVKRDKAEDSSTSHATWLTLHQAQVKVEAMGYRELAKIERERDAYRMKATDAQGRLVKIDVHPFTGEVINTAVMRSH
ncbi:MAG TPA: PepSY domain-containing protein [Thauera sp.]|nr:PepSY domain-containing protein [Thauera sp.]